VQTNENFTVRVIKLVPIYVALNLCAVISTSVICSISNCTEFQHSSWCLCI